MKKIEMLLLLKYLHIVNIKKNQLYLNLLQKVKLHILNQERMDGVGILYLYQMDIIKLWLTMMMKKDVKCGIQMHTIALQII